MLDTVFSELASPIRIINGPDTAEASRLAVNRQWRGEPLGDGVSTCDLLYKAAYMYCRLRGIRPARQAHPPLADDDRFRTVPAL